MTTLTVADGVRAAFGEVHLEAWALGGLLALAARPLPRRPAVD